MEADVLAVIVSHVQRVSLPPLVGETGDPLADAAKLVAKFEEDIGKTRTAVKGTSRSRSAPAPTASPSRRAAAPSATTR